MAKERFGKDIDKGLFPNVQGGSLYNHIAGKAVAFHEAAQPAYREYAAQVVRNAHAMAERFAANGVRVVSGGTDNHLMMIDMRSIDEELTGKEGAILLEELGITTNRNSIPFDPRPPFITSGIRMGTPAITTQGLGEPECEEVADLITLALKERVDESARSKVANRVAELANQFSPYPHDFSGHV
jgi:glycine hydroxymethyltransferase